MHDTMTTLHLSNYVVKFSGFCNKLPLLKIWEESNSNFQLTNHDSQRKNELKALNLQRNFKTYLKACLQ